MLPMRHDEDDHTPHLYPADPIVRITKFDVWLSIVAALLAAVYWYCFGS